MEPNTASESELDMVSLVGNVSMGGPLIMEERELLNSIIATSKARPVLVDFWAPWCEPCKTLTPTLDRLAANAEGEWELVKVNVDEAQILAAQFGIQSIPSVKLIHEGRLIGEFTGTKTEGEIVKWLEENLPKPETSEMDSIHKLMEVGDYEKARVLLGHKILQDSEDEESKILMAKCLLFDNPNEALELLDMFTESSNFYDKALNLRTLAGFITMDVELLPNDPVKEYFAKALKELKQGNFELTLDSFFEVLIRNREYMDDGARRGFIAIFDFLGRSNKITKNYIRRFEMAVFS